MRFQKVFVQFPYCLFRDVVEGVADAAYGAAVVFFFDQIQVCFSLSITIFT